VQRYALQNLEWTIFTTVTTKMTVVQLLILLLLDQLTEYFKTDLNIQKIKFKV
jgi:hypothetical protein